MSEGSFRTWDGLPVSREKPYGATVVVWRRARARRDREWLILHRRHRGARFEGDWAWTPPSGARFPEEPVEACARRELAEETGLALEPRVTACGSADWAVFAAEAQAGADVLLDAEHDRYLWASLEEVARRCRPRRVADGVACVAASLDREAGAARERP